MRKVSLADHHKKPAAIKSDAQRTYLLT